MSEETGPDIRLRIALMAALVIAVVSGAMVWNGGFEGRARGIPTERASESYPDDDFNQRIVDGVANTLEDAGL